MIQTSHMRELLEPAMLRRLIPATVRILKRLRAGGLEFDAIAFRGMSGALYAAPVAYLLNVPLIMVRKTDANGHTGSHSYYKVEGDLNAMTYLVLDDFISSGHTVREIVREIHEWNGAKCRGIVTAGGVARTYRRGYSDRGQKNDRLPTATFDLLPVEMFVKPERS